MELGSISKLLSSSKFADKAKEIEATFDNLGVKTLNDLDNAPAKLGLRTAGYSTYQLCAYLRKAAIDAVIAGDVEESEELLEPTPEPEPEVVTEDVDEVLEEVEPKESEEIKENE